LGKEFFLTNLNSLKKKIMDKMKEIPGMPERETPWRKKSEVELFCERILAGEKPDSDAVDTFIVNCRTFFDEFEFGNTISHKLDVFIRYLDKGDQFKEGAKYNALMLQDFAMMRRITRGATNRKGLENLAMEPQSDFFESVDQEGWDLGKKLEEWQQQLNAKRPDVNRLSIEFQGNRDIIRIVPFLAGNRIPGEFFYRSLFRAFLQNTLNHGMRFTENRESLLNVHLINDPDIGSVIELENQCSLEAVRKASIHDWQEIQPSTPTEPTFALEFMRQFELGNAYHMVQEEGKSGRYHVAVALEGLKFKSREK